MSSSSLNDRKSKTIFVLSRIAATEGLHDESWVDLGSGVRGHQYINGHPNFHRDDRGGVVPRHVKRAMTAALQNYSFFLVRDRHIIDQFTFLTSTSKHNMEAVLQEFLMAYREGTVACQSFWSAVPHVFSASSNTITLWSAPTGDSSDRCIHKHEIARTDLQECVAGSNKGSMEHDQPELETESDRPDLKRRYSRNVTYPGVSRKAFVSLGVSDAKRSPPQTPAKVTADIKEEGGEDVIRDVKWL